MIKFIRWENLGTLNREFIDSNVHKIYYLRQYVAGAGYERSETNSLINNLKKPVDSPKNQLHYKNLAIKKFASELIEGFTQFSTAVPIIMTWIPPSKCKDDPKHDDRIKRVVNIVCNKTGFIPLEVFENHTSREPLHSGHARNPLLISKNLVWCNLELKNCKIIFIIDDILTTGSTFRAIHDKIHDKFPHISVWGFFWAIAVHDC
jgi:predicted amidophosphoribosyltransferase